MIAVVNLVVEIAAAGRNSGNSNTLKVLWGEWQLQQHQ